MSLNAGIDSVTEMGKYQLDYKGMQQVERFHEKHSNVKNDKKARVQELLKKAQAKKIK
ncbi:hypothetical protein [Streptococcus porci]|uniref:hypothetical protein n=1 Tax=Streptococcus porci TaxID=502567 RepID=UPI00146E400E|nr:hypothetical protein [Streptococcus porci]